MTGSSQAVFLSYASEDAEAAQRICEALRAAGIEVWFDREELRGGDIWDQKIRRQIRECRLFVPVISANTEARDEGYFRREWKLAVDRLDDMAGDKTFLVPVVVDATQNTTARVPPRFQDVQWTRLLGGETPSAFVARVATLLGLGMPAVGPLIAVGAVANSSRRRPHPHRSRWAIVAIAALAVASAGSWLVWRQYRPGQFRASATATEKSIAVLPFVDMSESRDQEYLGDGLADEILHQLARLPGLKVIGRTSSFRFRGRSEDLHTVGAELKVAYVVEGSVRRANSQIRVTAQLIKVRDGSQQWSESYDRTLVDALRLQGEIATAIARVLQVSIGDYYVSGHSSESADAHDFYLRGLRDADMETPAAAQRALMEFDRALAIDPRFANALVGKAATYIALAANGYMPKETAYREARLALDRALALDPRNSDAYGERALLRINYERDWKGAESDLRAARQLGGAHDAYIAEMKLGGARGELARVAEILERELATNPFEPDCLNYLGGLIYPALGRYAESDAAMRKFREVNPSFTDFVDYQEGISLVLRGDFVAAAAHVDGETNEVAKETLRAIVEHAQHRPRESDEAMRRASNANTPWAIGLARAYAYLGDTSKALEWLDRAAATRDVSIWYVRIDPLMRNLANGPRFRAFIRANLPE